MNSKISANPLNSCISLPSFRFRFLDLPLDLRFQIYKLVFADCPRTINLVEHSSTSSVPLSRNTALLLINRQVLFEAAPALYQGKIFEAVGVEMIVWFLASRAEERRLLVKHMRLTQATLPYQEIEFYAEWLRQLYTIERILSQKLPSM